MPGTLTLPLTLNPSFPLRRLAVRAAVTEVSQSQSSRRRSLYEVLRVGRNASQVEIKTAYRALAKLHHPDSTSRFINSSMAAAAAAASSSDGRDFIEIHKAYATLSDPDSRAVYDSKLIADSQRRWSTVYRERFYPTRSWETDQCW